ncbi:MAG: hypothetical protein PVG39_00190 [Desulfobacteraceae bacterium]|jgi:hypothetical protein
MANAISIDLVGITRIQRKLTLLQNSIFSRALMTEIGLFAMTRIKSRTVEGKDVDGTPFKPYSPKYAMFRQEHGHPTNKVNLTFSGSMLSSMTFNPDADKVTLYFLNTYGFGAGNKSHTSNPKKAFFLNEERRFFALSGEDVEDIVDIVERYYRRLIA